MAEGEVFAGDALSTSKGRRYGRQAAPELVVPERAEPAGSHLRYRQVGPALVYPALRAISEAASVPPPERARDRRWRVRRAIRRRALAAHVKGVLSQKPHSRNRHSRQVRTARTAYRYPPM